MDNISTNIKTVLERLKDSDDEEDDEELFGLVNDDTREPANNE